MATSPITASNSIDVNGIVTALMNVEREPLKRIETNTQGVRSTISEVGKLQAALDKFRTTAASLARAETWQSASASSGDETAVGIKAATGALQGSYSVDVQQLASPQTVVSSAMASPLSVIGGGTLTFRMGTQSPTGFRPDLQREALTITIAPGSTLQDVSKAINLANPDVGASLVTDANGTRLMLRSTESGDMQAFRIMATVDGTAGTGENQPTLPGKTFPVLSLADLRFDPGQTGGEITQTQTAANAKFELNGLALESASNDPDGILENISLSLRKVTTDPVALEVSTDSESIRTRLDEFVSGYNELNSLIRAQTRYDAETQTAGPLQGNRMVLMVQQQLRQIVGTTLPDSALPPTTGTTTTDAFRRLSDIGLQVGRDGTLSVDSARMDLALASPDKLNQFFAAGGLDAASHGFGRRFDTLIGNFLGADGAITGLTESLRSRETDLTRQQERYERRLDDIQQRLLRQYTALDANLSTMTAALATVSKL